MEPKRSKNQVKASADEPAKCPICDEAVKPDRPAAAGAFCSRRCRQIDLGRWLGGDYTISRPIEQADLDEV